MSAHDLFATSYAQARQNFLRFAKANGHAVTSHVLPTVRGLEGEELSTDIAYIGPSKAQRILVLTSGTHGVEGFCGSAIQMALLQDTPLQERLTGLNVGLLLVHAVNPYGFSYCSRTTHENVDLNRNGWGFQKAPPKNPAYDELHALLIPKEWPPSPENARAITHFIDTHGKPAYQDALTLGQYKHADGLFFGGLESTWNTRVLQTTFAEYGARCSHIGWLDVHTGLGPAGHGEKICVGSISAEELQRARAWWGADVTSSIDGTSVASDVFGPLLDILRRDQTACNTTAIAIEYGTIPLIEMLELLRADVWLRQNPNAPDAVKQAIRQKIRAAFYFADGLWQGMILGQARTAVLQGLIGLSRA